MKWYQMPTFGRWMRERFYISVLSKAILNFFSKSIIRQLILQVLLYFIFLGGISIACIYAYWLYDEFYWLEFLGVDFENIVVIFFISYFFLSSSFFWPLLALYFLRIRNKNFKSLNKIFQTVVKLSIIAILLFVLFLILGFTLLDRGIFDFEISIWENIFYILIKFGIFALIFITPFLCAIVPLLICAFLNKHLDKERILRKELHIKNGLNWVKNTISARVIIYSLVILFVLSIVPVSLESYQEGNEYIAEAIQYDALAINCSSVCGAASVWKCIYDCGGEPDYIDYWNTEAAKKFCSNKGLCEEITDIEEYDKYNTYPFDVSWRDVYEQYSE